MPIRVVNNLRVVVTDYNYQKKYWPILTGKFTDKYGTAEVKDPTQVQDALKEYFEYLCNEFMTLLEKENRASFFIFVQDLHEDATEIYARRLGGEVFAVNGEDFAGSRRVMKFILEQGCSIPLIGCPNFLQEIRTNIQQYAKHLDELMYIGQKTFELSEMIARSQICPKAIGLAIHEGELTTFTYPPFNSIFEFIFHDIDEHNRDVVLSNSLYEFKEILNDKVGINYDNSCSFIFEQMRERRRRFGAFDLETLIDSLHDTFGYSKSSLKKFYSGLILSKTNVLSLQECILKSQDTNRYTFRPILQYQIEGKDYFFVGANKWSESLALLTTNCIPFGNYPQEWETIPELNTFIVKVKNTHDAILENPAVELIKNAGWKVDRNVKHLKRPNNQNISTITANVGEIDILFLDENLKTIFIGECKHNRARYEYNNWKRDIDTFRKKYEKKLQNKHQWITNNKAYVLGHFEIMYNTTISDKDTYQVTPLFILNVPTLYMYDSDFLCTTLFELDLLLQGRYPRNVFTGELNGKKVELERPYFKNAENYLKMI